MREVVLWGQFAVIIDEVVQDGWAQDGLQEMDPEGEVVTARHALRVQVNTAEDKVRPAAEQVTSNQCGAGQQEGATMNSQSS